MFEITIHITPLVIPVMGAEYKNKTLFLHDVLKPAFKLLTWILPPWIWQKQTLSAVQIIYNEKHDTLLRVVYY